MEISREHFGVFKNIPDEREAVVKKIIRAIGEKLTKIFKDQLGIESVVYIFYPPKSSNLTFSSGIPQSSAILRTA